MRGSSAASVSISTIASFAPSRAKRWAIAPPMPPPPPVTITILLSIAPIAVSHLIGQVIEEFVQLLNPTNLRVIEGLIVRPVRHENQCIGFSGDVLAVLVAIVDEKPDVQLAHKHGFLVLGKMHDRISHSVVAEPIASDLTDIVGIAHPAMGDEDDFVVAGDLVERLPLCRRRQRRQSAPEIPDRRRRLPCIRK